MAVTDLAPVDARPSALGRLAAESRAPRAERREPRAESREPRADRRRSPYLVPFAIFAIVAIVAMWAVSPYPVGIFQDDGIYVVLGKALASGEGYRYLHLPGEPAATHYPPGYPALLAVLWKIAPEFPANVALFKFVNAALVALACAVLYRFAERRLALGAPAAALVALAGGLAVPTLVVAGMVLSEPLFLALLVATLLAAEPLADPAERASLRRAAGVGALAGLLVLVRTIGFVIVPAVGIAVLVRRRDDLRRAVSAAAVVAAGAVAVVLPWQVFVWRHAAALSPELQGKYGSYTAWLADGWRHDGLAFGVRAFAENARQLYAVARQLFATRLPGWWQVVAAAVVLGLLALGMARAWRRAPVTALFTAAYLAIVLVWPFDPTRFLLGLWPLVLALVALGVAAVAGWQPGPSRWRPARAAALVLSALVLLGSLSYYASGYRHRYWDSIPRALTPPTITVVKWVARHTRPGDVVAGDAEALVWLYTGRQGVPMNSYVATDYIRPRPAREARAALSGILRSSGADWIVTGSRSAQEAAELMRQARPPELRLVDTLPGGIAVFIPSRP